MSLAAVFVFLVVSALQLLDRYIDLARKRGSHSDEQIKLRLEIKQLLEEASQLSTPSTFAQSAKLKRLAAAKEKELVKIRGQDAKGKNSLYDKYGRLLLITKVLICAVLVLWFWSTPVTTVPKHLLQPFGRMFSLRSSDAATGRVVGEKTRTATDGREEPSDSGPTTPLPDKKLLVFILDRLQKKDTYGVFSEPVDPEELPDYHDIVKDPMDFSTVRKKLDKGAYASLEQFEDDVFLITSNAMCYNSPDTIYYRQARAIQEVAKKDFENLRQDSDASEPEPEPEPLPEPEPKPQRRRGRPPKNTVKQKVGRPPAELATAEFSGATVATAGNSGHHAHLGFDLQQRMADVLKASFANRNNEQNWSSERKLERIEDYSASGSKWSGKMGKKPLVVEESRRSTYYQHQPSSLIYELPVATSYNGTRKLLVPVGVQLQHSYSRSLARFAARLGPVGWEVASKQIEQVIPPGTKFGRGWVGDGESPNTFQPPVLTSSSTAMTTPSSTTACSVQANVDDPASASHSAGPQPHAESYASTSTVQRIDSQALSSEHCESLSQTAIDRADHGGDMKGNHNVHERAAMHHTVNGFNSVPGSIVFAPTAQLVASRMQTHTAD